MYVVRGPVVNSIYTAIRYLISVFSSEPGKRLRQAVLIDMSASAGKQIGYMICSDFSEFPDLHYAEGQVSVYRSFSYQIGGGVTVIMPPTSGVPLDSPAEDALRFVASAGIIGHVNYSSPQVRLTNFSDTHIHMRCD